MNDNLTTKIKDRLLEAIMGIMTAVSGVIAFHLSKMGTIWLDHIESDLTPNRFRLVIGLAIITAIVAVAIPIIYHVRSKSIRDMHNDELRTKEAAQAKAKAKRVVESFPIMIDDFMLTSGAIVDGKYDRSESYKKKPGYRATIERMIKTYLTPETVDAYRDYSEEQITPIEQPRSPMDKKLG
jgi:hypothetical protein